MGNVRNRLEKYIKGALLLNRSLDVLVGNGETIDRFVGGQWHDYISCENYLWEEWVRVQQGGARTIGSI